MNDLTPDLLKNKCSSYEDLQEYLRLRGREAYFQKMVSRLVSLRMASLCNGVLEHRTFRVMFFLQANITSAELEYITELTVGEDALCSLFKIINK